MSLVRVDTIKPITSSADLSLQGDNGGSAVDCLNITSAGDVNFSGNTDAKIKLPSAGGIYGSDGTTALLTESGGSATLGSGVGFPAGHVLQCQSAHTGAYQSITANIPIDDTAPQNTEGGEVLTVAITPAHASNTLLILGNVMVSASALNAITVALFKDSVASAIAVVNTYPRGGGEAWPNPISHKISAGSTSAQTFKLRVGGHDQNTQINGNTSGRLYAGLNATTLTVFEFQGAF